MLTRHGNISICRTFSTEDDQVLLAKSIILYNLNNIASQHIMGINMEKTKITAFIGMEPIRNKLYE
jgi:hypothetical protein